MAKRVSQEDTDNDFKSVSALAERLGLTGEAKDSYVHRHMSKLGHKSQRRYVPGEAKSSSSDDDDDWSF